MHAVRRMLFAVSLLVPALLAACSSDSGTDPIATGSLELRAAYAGTLGVVGAEHMLVAELYKGVSATLPAVPYDRASTAQNPDTLHFDQLSPGTYSLWLYVELDSASLEVPDPCELYADKGPGETPDSVVIAADATTSLAVTFDDRHLTGTLGVALPDSNPASATYGATWDLAEQEGPTLLYFPVPSPGRAPDFALEDLNATSPTHGETFTLADFAGQHLLLYFAAVNCGHCTATFEEATEIVFELQGEGIPATAALINDAIASGFVDLIEGHSTLPLLQDVFNPQFQSQTRAAYECVQHDYFYVIDAGGCHYRRHIADNDFDLLDAASRDTVATWLRAAVAGAGSAATAGQYALLETLVAEAAAAGVNDVAALAVNPQGDGCLRAALIAAQAQLPILEDRADGLWAASGAQAGELLLVDRHGWIHARTQLGAAGEMDLSRAADRATLVAWLQAME